MKSTDRSRSKQKSDYTSLFMGAILLLLVGLALDGTGGTPVHRFIEGLVFGMSIACSVIGLVVYVRSAREKTN